MGQTPTPPPPPHVPSSHKAIISRYQGFKLCEVKGTSTLFTLLASSRIILSGSFEFNVCKYQEITLFG